MGCTQYQRPVKPSFLSKISGDSTLQQVRLPNWLGDINMKDLQNSPIKDYDPTCREKQFNVLVGGVLFQIVNPAEEFLDSGNSEVLKEE